MILVPQGEDIPPAARAASSRRTATSALGREGRVGTNTSAHQYRHIEGRPKHPGKTALAFALKDATKTAIWTVVPGKLSTRFSRMQRQNKNGSAPPQRSNSALVSQSAHQLPRYNTSKHASVSDTLGFVRFMRPA